MTVATAPVRGSPWFRAAVALLRLGRPMFLLGGGALYCLGALFARVGGGDLSTSDFFWGLLAVLSIQLMTHYSNDYFDYEGDRVNLHPTPWSGGSGVLVRDELPRRAGLWAALAMALLAVSAMMGLAAAGPQHISVTLLGAMLLLAWSYSSPPLRLHRRGLGEPTVALIVPVLTPLSGFIIQTQAVSAALFALCLPLAMLQTVMLLTLQFPDETADRSVGKRTWVVLFGPRRVAGLCVALILLAFATTLASSLYGVPVLVTQVWWLLTPLAAFQVWRMLAKDWHSSRRWSRLEFGSVALFFLAVLVDLGALSIEIATD